MKPTSKKLKKLIDKKEKLQKQLKQAEALYLKVQGALELIETLIEEEK
tara:strand:+ start:7124 stop:7267 length:144 start_codon:yes stop_codon:yes gene_type:complete